MVEGTPVDRQLEALATQTIDAAVKLHIALGPGLLESVYAQLLAAELRRRGLQVERHRRVPIEFNGLVLPNALRLDLFVGDHLLVELKSVEVLAPVHYKQLLTYLRLMQLPLGILLNFGAATMKDGIHRIVNGYGTFASSRFRVSQKGGRPES